MSFHLLSSKSSDDEEFGASGVDDYEEEDAGSDMGSLDSGTRPRQLSRGLCKQQPSRTNYRARKHPRQLRKHTSEEDSDEEIGQSYSKFFVLHSQF